MRKGIGSGLAAALVLAGCDMGYRPPKVDPATLPEDSCLSAPWQPLLGEPEAVLKAKALPDPVRIIPFGAMITQDHVPGRLNFSLDPVGQITRIWCG
jgi:hypothetical protein